MTSLLYYFKSNFICNSSNCASAIVEGDSVITSRPILFLGKAMKSRMLSCPPNNEQSLSKPNANPACGGAPYSKAFIKKPNCDCALSSVKPNVRNILFCKSRLKIRTEPPPISTPLRTMS